MLVHFISYLLGLWSVVASLFVFTKKNKMFVYSIIALFILLFLGVVCGFCLNVYEHLAAMLVGLRIEAMKKMYLLLSFMAILCTCLATFGDWETGKAGTENINDPEINKNPKSYTFLQVLLINFAVSIVVYIN